MIDRCRKVYFAKCIGPTGVPLGAYKIGCSSGWNERIKSVTAQLPFTLEVAAVVPGDMVMEAAVHMRLREHRIAGEYFHASEFVEARVQYAAAHGQAFSRIFDLGYYGCSEADVAAFMAYHGVTYDDVSAYLNVPRKNYETGKTARATRKVVAATALIASDRDHHVNWPDDIIAGSRGEVSPRLGDLVVSVAA